MRELLELPEPPTAVFAAADMMAVGAIRTATNAGLVVPGDLAVVGFDDIELAALLSPPLTTIRQDKLGLGLAAARAIVEQIENPEVTPPALTLPVELVVRASSGGATGGRGKELDQPGKHGPSAATRKGSNSSSAKGGRR
jgi:LacI family transcriptional regulator